MRIPVLLVSFMLLFCTQVHSAAHSDSVYLFLRGYFSEALGRYDDAEANYSKALREDPGSAELRTSLASLFVKKGELQKAEELLDEAIAIAPTNRVALLILAGIHASKGVTY
ncbi:MAG TPA: tetratricopeptide repeat protein, partial [Syntrophorhabdaceae bacterium]|nr:tetratricopeptide repeat protein [Syntrophorhabdaceae bacterium]